jgi:hypothetical protein
MCKAKALPPTASRYIRNSVWGAHIANPISILLSGAVGMAIPEVISVYPFKGWSEVWHGLVFMVVIFPIIIVPVWLIFRQVAKQSKIPFAIRVCVKNGICSACGYNIKGLEPQDDGCTVCPECGAAWRLVPGMEDDDARK